jgi:isocitrate lyase
MAAAGLDAIYLSGWQTAADNNLAGQMYPDQSLYPASSAPSVCKALNNALQRADQIQHLEGGDVDYYKPIIADAEAGFGGNLNAYELMKAFIEAGAGAVHFEDQLSSAKKCGHLGGKVLVPTQEFINKLKAAQLAAAVADVPTVLIARTDANSARLLTSNHDSRDKAFVTSGVTSEGFCRITGGLDMAIDRGLSYAPYADLLWCETSKPDLAEAKRFADAIHNAFPNQMLAYNCSPSFNWKAHPDKTGELAEFQNELAKMGYCYQFITLAGFHNLNLNMFKLARDYKARGMAAYSEMQEEEFAQTTFGFGAVKHQHFVGTSYFDAVQKTVSNSTETVAMDDSTETEQF